MRQALETIRRRVDALGVTEPSLQIYGESGQEVQDQIIVELPGVDDPDRVKSLIENTAQLELRLVKKDQANAFSSIDSAVAASGGKIAEGYEILPYRENRGEQSQLEYLIVSKMSGYYRKGPENSAQVLRFEWTARSRFLFDGRRLEAVCAGDRTARG